MAKGCGPKNNFCSNKLTFNRQINPSFQSYIIASGGTVITDGNYKIHVFTANDTFIITQAPFGATIEYLIVAGGGGGGNGYGGVGGGGGGAGGLITSTALAAIGTFPVVIGNGGNGATAGIDALNGSNGSNSTFYSLTAIGGGGGNSFSAAVSGSGGSAGGAAWSTGSSGTATVGQGNIGGIRTTGVSAGGGGGAGALGGNGSAGGGGIGGIGIQSSISGVAYYYAGGGGGAIYDSATLGVGGQGGGGRGGFGGDHNGVSATANTGGGGGGGYLNDGTGGSGGSGIVIVRYQYMASCYPNLNNATLNSYLVNSNTIGYSTFQSHNQKVVSNANGVFFTYLVTSNAPYTNQGWYLAKTTDGGQSFTSLYNNASTQSAPCIETDSSNNLYLIVPTTATDATFYKFLSSDYTTPSVTTTLTGLAQEKYAMALDEANNKIYFTSNSNKFVVLNMSGTVVTAPYTFTQNGTYAVAEYPHLQIDGNGTLYCAWTTHDAGPRTYWNISWLKSTDFGVSWKKADGTAITLPVKVDTSGPCNMITRTEEISDTTFLSSLMYANERLHAVYYMVDSTGAQKQEYARINPTTGVVEVRTIQFLNCNPTYAGLDGFFIKPTVDGAAASPVTVYFITEVDKRYIVSSISTDNGATWKRTKILDMNPPSGWRVYSVGGFRNLVGGDKAYGTFTLQDLNTPPYYQNGSGKTYFIKLDL